MNKIMKKFDMFFLGICRCGCDKDINLRNASGYLKRFLPGHNTKGINNPRYKGGKTSTEEYPMLNMPWHPNSDKQGYILTHVFIMSRHLKRPLKKGEVVHHVDGNKSNFDINNLQLLSSQGEHRTLHRINMTDRSCSNCQAIETQITKGKYISWYNDLKGGWLCRKCYCKKNYKYIKKR